MIVLPPDHEPINQEDFRGLYARGDTVPDGFFSDCLNVKYNEKEVSTRDGSILSLTAANIVRFFVYKRSGETPRFIYLDSAGSLFDSLFPNNPIYTDATFTDFSMVNYNNRAYITPHNRVQGIPNKSVLVYEGSGVARPAAGSAPSGFVLTATNSATAGTVEEGIHIFAVCYITSSGFITAPGPLVFAQLSTPGDKKVDINLPIGPATTAGRIILATKSIPVSLFTGNQFGYELFFVPNATILDNVTASTTIDFYDASLVDSADYLLDNLTSIPAGLGLVVYNERLGVWASNGLENVIRLSEPGQPEVFNSISGFITLNSALSVGGIKNAVNHRKTLVLFCSNKIFATADNQDDPSTWVIGDPIDQSAGTECFGVANILDARGTNTDRVWFADRSGLINFEGYVRRPELSYNIEDIWKRINKAYFNLVQVVDDALNHRVYITVPLDNSTTISHILFADYSQAFTVYGTIDEKAFKWAIWTFHTPVKSIAGDSDVVTVAPLIYVLLTAGISNVKDGNPRNDSNNAITSYINTNQVTLDVNYINHFAFISMRVRGAGNLAITLYGQDHAKTTIPTNGIALSLVDGKDRNKLINFTNENLELQLKTSLAGEYFILNRLTVHAKRLWLRRAS